MEEHLLFQFLNGTADEALQQRVASWLDASPDHREILDRLEAFWLETGKLVPPPLAVDVDAAWARVSKRIFSEPAGRQINMIDSARSRRLWYLSAAAAAILLFAGLFALYRYSFTSPPATEILASAQIVHDTLPDGTRVTLNRNSKLTVESGFTDGKRDVRLEGEGFFEVSHDPQHPFTVHAGKTQVQVLGTVFTVEWRNGNARVNLSEGKVRFSAPAQNGGTSEVILSPGQEASWSEKAPAPAASAANPPDTHFWADSALEFRGQPLSEVISVVEKCYGIRISVSDPAILKCRLTASFRGEPAGRLVDVIAGSFGLEMQASGTNYQLTGPGCDENK